MKIDRNTILFFDSSCLIAASGSPSGGSGFLLSLCARKILKGAISQPVLLEAQRNIQGKLGNSALNEFFKLLSMTPLILASLPGAPELLRIGQLVNAKDAHVVAAAIEADTQFLLTLDKKLIEQVKGAGLELSALTPGDFIKSVLTLHTDYPKDEGA